MCLLLLAYRAHDDYPLIVAANRDEFHYRPTAPAAWWREPRILAGRDLQAGGTWMAVAPDGRWAALTNYRDPAVAKENVRSRGELVPEVVAGGLDQVDGMPRLMSRVGDYNGFNLLYGAPESLHYVSDRSVQPQRLQAGVYGLSNHSLDTDWPKVRRGREMMRRYLQSGELGGVEPLFGLLADRHQPGDEQLPATGVPMEWERLLAPMFILDPQYGTRSSTALLMHRSGDILFAERTFDPSGRQAGTRSFCFRRR